MFTIIVGVFEEIKSGERWGLRKGSEYYFFLYFVLILFVLVLNGFV